MEQSIYLLYTDLLSCKWAFCVFFCIPSLTYTFILSSMRITKALISRLVCAFFVRMPTQSQVFSGRGHSFQIQHSFQEILWDRFGYLLVSKTFLVLFCSNLCSLAPRPWCFFFNFTLHFIHYKLISYSQTVSSLSLFDMISTPCHKYCYHRGNREIKEIIISKWNYHL